MPLDFNDWLYLALLSLLMAGQMLIALTVIFISGYIIRLRLEIDQKTVSKSQLTSSIRRRLQL